MFIDNILTDDDLIIQFSTGSNEAYRILERRYFRFAHKVAKDYFFVYCHGSGVALDDLHSLCVSMFYHAINRYIVGSGTFYSYWDTICKRAMAEYFTNNSYTNKGRSFAGDYFLDSLEEEDWRNEETLGKNDENIGFELIKEELQKFISDSRNGFSKDEINMIMLLVEGNQIEDLQRKYNLSLSSIYRIRSSATSKLKPWLDRLKR